MNLSFLFNLAQTNQIIHKVLEMIPSLSPVPINSACHQAALLMLVN
jgi:hypothetical protein